MSVFVNKEMGAVRFIGCTEFAEGVWLGVELRKPRKCGASLLIEILLLVFSQLVRMTVLFKARSISIARLTMVCL